MAKNVVFSKEEKLADYRDIAVMLLSGWSYARMREELGRSRQYCSNIKQDLVNMNVITQKDIDDGKELVRNKMNQELDELVYQILSSEKNASNTDIKELIANIRESVKQIQDQLASIDVGTNEEVNTRTREEEEKKKKLRTIKKLVKDDKSISEIHKITGYPISTINRYIEILIENKKIKKSDVKNEKQDQKIRNKERDEKILALIEFKIPYEIIAAVFGLSPHSIAVIKNRHSNTSKPNFSKVKKSKKEIEIKEIDETLTKLEVDIIKYLKAGYYYTYIYKKLSISQKDLMDIINSLKERAYISQSVINEARDNRNVYYKEMILGFYNDAISEADIYRTLNKDDDIEEISKSNVNKIINKLKDEGLIDDDRIKQLLDDKPESFASIDKKVLALLPEGLTIDEMVESDETKVLTEFRINSSIKRLINAGKTSEAEILKYKIRRKKKLKKEEMRKEDDRIWYYIATYGFSNSEIAEQIDVSYNYVCERVKKISRRKRMSDQKLRDFRKKALFDGQKIAFFTYEENLIRQPFLEIKSDFLKMYADCIPTESVNISYFNSFKEIVSLNCSFDKQEVDILSYVVLYTDGLCIQDNISIVVMSYLHINEVESAIQTLNDFISITGFKNQSYAFQQQIMERINDYKNGKKKRLNILS